MNQVKKTHLGKELINDLLTIIEDKLIKLGLKAEDAEKISTEATIHVQSTFGGCSLYIPKFSPLTESLKERNDQIFKAFDGKNHADLARKFNLSMQSVYKILAARNNTLNFRTGKGNE
jgi:Mor family transcriptional regulator